MVEKKAELRRKRARRKKTLKLKDRLARAKDGKERELVVAKIQAISPWWKEAVKAR